MTFQRHALMVFLFAVVPAINAAEQPANVGGTRPESGPARPPAPGGEFGKDHRRGGHDGRGESGMSIGRLLEMDDARLARMRELIERVEKLPVSERAALRKRLQAACESSPADREAMQRELHEKFGLPSPEKMRGGEGKVAENKVGQGKGVDGKGGPGKSERGAFANQRPVHDLLEKHFSSMAPDQAKSEKEKFLAMSRDGKVAYLKALRTKYGQPVPNEVPGSGDTMMQAQPRQPKPVKPKAPDRDDPFRTETP